MVKFKILDASQSDVSDLLVKGWHIMIFRGDSSYEDFLIVSKKGVKFVVKIVDKWGYNVIEITKYIDGVKKDMKQFYDHRCGLNGTYSISEGKSDDLSYMFFRNESLTKLMDEFGLKRVMFPRESCERFEKDVYLDMDKSLQYNGNAYKNIPFFHTDGEYAQVESEVPGSAKWHISDAKYIYEYNTKTLTIPQLYNVDDVRQWLKELTE